MEAPLDFTVTRSKREPILNIFFDASWLRMNTGAKLRVGDGSRNFQIREK